MPIIPTPIRWIMQIAFVASTAYHVISVILPEIYLAVFAFSVILKLVAAENWRCEMGAGLEGNYFVFPTSTALSRAGKLTNDKAKEFYKLRKLTLKLRWWPQGDSACGSDIDWDWIKTLENRRIGELRIDEPINGHENVRVIFFKANQSLPGEPMSRIWLLDVFAKKRQDFSTIQIGVWRAHRELILQRSYDGIFGA